MYILYIILKDVIWRFQIYNLFREIFKFREDKSNNVFREIRKCFRKTAKFESSFYSAKLCIFLSHRCSPLEDTSVYRRPKAVLNFTHKFQLVLAYFVMLDLN